MNHSSFSKKYYFYCLVTIFYSFPAIAQININGRVVDDTDDKPSAGAFVYFNNTTLATTADQQGQFTFETLRLLNTELVISTPGYELLVYKPAAEKIDKKRVVFKLHKAQTVKEKPSVKAVTRQQLLPFFYTSFLGVTHEADKCTIENEKDIYFAEGASINGFTVYADSPLIVVNDLLGYKLRYDLVEYTFDFSTGQKNLIGYTYYQDLGQDKKWVKNRKDNYAGSKMHFYRSLFSRQSYEQGFNTFLLQPADTSLHKMDHNMLIVPGQGPMNVIPITAPQILFIDSTNNISIRVDGQLLVQYYKNPASRDFLEKNDYLDGLLLKGVQSYIFFKTGSVGINMSGVLSEPDSVDYAGYWNYEKAANTLPYDYQPE